MTADYSIKDEYAGRFDALTSTAQKLSQHLINILSSVPRIDAISARAKNPDRYFAKAMKLNEDGTKKYDNPKYQIQDQIGARVTVFYLSDVDVVKELVIKQLRFIEEQSKIPQSDSEFGYFGHHFIVATPDDIIPDDDCGDVVPEFFELQIKTLFQHAWSEAHHDLGYKAYRELIPDEKRKVAFTAAQAWGADTIFQELANSLVTNDNLPKAE